MTRFTETRLVVALAAFATIAVLSLPAAARERAHRRAHAVRVVPQTAPPQDQAARPPVDDLYRRRGYGIGGPVFGGDTALAGTCADLRFAEPASCGRGFGIYGNGLGTRFGSP